MILKVNEDRCVGCGCCEAQFLNNFKVDDKGIAKFRGEINDHNGTGAIIGCPVEAIGEDNAETN